MVLEVIGVPRIASLRRTVELASLWIADWVRSCCVFSRVFAFLRVLFRYSMLRFSVSSGGMRVCPIFYSRPCFCSCSAPLKVSEHLCFRSYPLLATVLCLPVQGSLGSLLLWRSSVGCSQQRSPKNPSLCLPPSCSSLEGSTLSSADSR